MQGSSKDNSNLYKCLSYADEEWILKNVCNQTGLRLSKYKFLFVYLFIYWVNHPLNAEPTNAVDWMWDINRCVWSGLQLLIKHWESDREWQRLVPVYGMQKQSPACHRVQSAQAQGRVIKSLGEYELAGCHPTQKQTHNVKSESLWWSTAMLINAYLWVACTRISKAFWQWLQNRLYRTLKFLQRVLYFYCYKMK